VSNFVVVSQDGKSEAQIRALVADCSIEETVKGSRSAQEEERRRTGEDG